MVRACPACSSEMTEKVRVFAETCEYFRVASDVVAKREKNQGGEEEEQILARIKVLPEHKISNVRFLGDVSQ